jgi:hypothetical protein
MLDTVVAMPDVVVAIVTAKKLTEKGLPNNSLLLNSQLIILSLVVLICYCFSRTTRFTPI